MAKYSVDYDGDLSTTDDRVSYGSFDAAVGGIGDRGFSNYGVQDNRRGGGGNLGSFGIGSRDDPGGRAGAGWGALNDARRVGGGGGFFGNVTPGRIAGGLLGGLFGGPIGGMIGAGIGGGMGGGRGGWGYVDAQGNRVSAGRDMVDGGGAGRSGNQFEGGGLLSRIGNGLGIRPAGYNDRQAAMQSQMSADQVRAGMGGSGGIPPVGVTDRTGTSLNVQQPSYAPIDIAGPVRDLPPPGFNPNMPSASQRYLDMYGLPNNSAPANFMSLMPPPNAYAPYGLENPAMDATFQGASGVNVGRSDLGTIRGGFSAGSQAIRRPPSAGSMPSVDTQSYRAAVPPAAMSQPPMTGQYNPVFSGFNVIPGLDVGAPARVAPSMFQPTAITGTRGQGVAQPAQPYGADASAATRRMIDALQAERFNRGNVVRRVYNN